MESTILLVDDVRLFLEMQKEFLQYADVNVITAQNGLEALTVIRNQRPDLVFMDLEMPEMDGAACCRAIKSNPALAAIPVVMITAKGDETSQQVCRLAGCDEFLTKPLNRSIFLEAAGRFVVDLDRREKRKPVILSATIRSRGTSIASTLHNLSAGGAFVAAECDAEVGRIIEVSFALPDGSSQECRAKVVWSQQAGRKTPRGFGIAFVLLPEEARKALERYLKTTTPPTPAPARS